MLFGDIIRSAASPVGNPHGIGGDHSVIWYGDYHGTIYELSVADFSIIQSRITGGTSFWGIGGNKNVVWADWRDGVTHHTYELSPIDLSTVRRGSIPNSTGLGGDENVIWQCDSTGEKVRELAVTDFSILREVASPNDNPNGIGGNVNVIWLCDRDNDKVYQLNPSDLSVLKTVTNSTLNSYGIGGAENSIWQCSSSPDEINELASLYTPPSTHESFHPPRIIVIIPTPPDLVEIKVSGRSIIVEDIESYSTPEDVPSLIFDNPTEPEQPLYYRSQYTKNVEFTRVFIKGTIASAGDVVYLMTSDQFGQNIFPEVIV